MKNRSARADALRKAPRTHTPSLSSFRSTVLGYWKKEGRHDLPWRKTKDPYKILVSEVMLQQTQVSRVIEKYQEFLKEFPTVKALADAELADVLKIWSGLGYNRRGKYLHDAAKIVVGQYRGNIRSALNNKLPGVGPYTESAVRVFAFNEPDVLIETNIRAVYIHYFASGMAGSVLRRLGEAGSISDKQLVPLTEKAAEGQDPRTWHWALMDYGVHIKKLHKNLARKSAHYTKQSKFEGSLRQVRGAILRELHRGEVGEYSIYSLIRANRPIRKTQFVEAMASLERDGLVVKKKGRWRIA